MKTLIFTTIMLYALFGYSQEKQFNRACKKNTVEAYEKFSNKFPDSEFTEEAEYKKTELVNTSSAYEHFLKKYPSGKFSDKAENCLCRLEYFKIYKTDKIELFKAFLERFYGCQYYNSVVRKTLIKLEYKKTESLNTIDAYEHFIKEYPANGFESQAKNSIERLDFEVVKEKKTIEAYNDFIEKYPQGNYTNEVKRRLVNLEFQDAIDKNSIEAFDLFFGKYSKCSKEYYDKAIDYLNINLQDYNQLVSRYPNSKLAKTVQKRYENNKYNEICSSYKLKYDIKELERFVEEFPDSEYKYKIQNRINSISNDKNGKNIFDLLSEKKIKIKTQGSNITEVSVRIRKLVPYNVTVLVPPGTFFISHSSSSQNMVTRRHKKIHLTDDNWHNYSIDAACANRIKDIPGEDDSFQIQRSPNQKELEILMKVLSEENVSSGVEQAAIWIVTDNADYDDLGILIRRSAYQYYGGTRVIEEYEAAKAMQICAKAKISLKRKAIWRDKTEILNGLKNGELKVWLQNY